MWFGPLLASVLLPGCANGGPAATVDVPAVTGAAVVDAAAPPPAPPPPAWPAPGAPLRVLDAPLVTGTLLLDAGHGAPDNEGNTNWRCEREGSVMRRVTDGVADALTPRIRTVTRTRPTVALVPYPDRLRASRKADWFVSLHSDSRAGTNFRTDPTTSCFVTSDAAGFSILWSDEGPPALVERRHALARALARRMVDAGFAPYLGVDYAGLYDGDDVPGVFVDRHAPRKRIMLLRRPTVPSVIVETHQAWDPEEAARWEEPATWGAFAGALAAALGEVPGG